MRASGREWLITILRLEATVDVHNQPVEHWTPLCQVWASKVDVSDGERLSAAQVGASITSRFRTIWSDQIADLNPKDRLLCAGRSYDISGVKELGRRDGFEITASARTDEL